MSFRTTVISTATRLLGLLRSPVSPIPDAPQRILVLKPCCLGDVLFTTPLLAAIRQHYPDANITYGTTSWSAPMVATSRDINRLWLLPESWTGGSFIAVLRALRDQNYDLVFVPDRSPIVSGLVALAGIAHRIGLDSAGRGFGYTRRVAVPDGIIHEADLYNLLGVAVGMQVARRLHFFIDDKSRAAAQAVLRSLASHGRPLVIIHPSGGANPGMILTRKRWLPERWAEVADQLIRQSGATVLLVGGPGDEESVVNVQQAMHYTAANIVQRWDWSVLAAVIAEANLFLGHDTGMMHLACAVSTPTLAVFGPSDPQMYGPYGVHTAFVWHPTPPSPCIQNGQVLGNCPCAYQCMEAIVSAEVYEKAQKLLETARHVLGLKKAM